MVGRGGFWTVPMNKAPRGDSGAVEVVEEDYGKGWFLDCTINKLHGGFRGSGGGLWEGWFLDTSGETEGWKKTWLEEGAGFWTIPYTSGGKEEGEGHSKVPVGTEGGYRRKGTISSVPSTDVRGKVV